MSSKSKKRTKLSKRSSKDKATAKRTTSKRKVRDDEDNEPLVDATVVDSFIEWDFDDESAQLFPGEEVVHRDDDISCVLPLHSSASLNDGHVHAATRCIVLITTFQTICIHKSAKEQENERVEKTAGPIAGIFAIQLSLKDESHVHLLFGVDDGSLSAVSDMNEQRMHKSLDATPWAIGRLAHRLTRYGAVSTDARERRRHVVEKLIELCFPHAGERGFFAFALGGALREYLNEVPTKRKNKPSLRTSGSLLRSKGNSRNSGARYSSSQVHSRDSNMRDSNMSMNSRESSAAFSPSMSMASASNLLKNESVTERAKFALDVADDQLIWPGWEMHDLLHEYHRQGIAASARRAVPPGHRWRLTDVNALFGFCPSYPSLFAVPAEAAWRASDLANCAMFRSRARIPATVWVHPTTGAPLVRCSQPMVGLTGRHNDADELLLDRVRRASRAGENSFLRIIDARPRLNADVNRIRGGGFESASRYANSRLEFGDIGNIHVIRKCLTLLRSHARELSPQMDADARDTSIRNASGWYEQLGLILFSVTRVVRFLDRDAMPSLLHCTDGWDRTAQISAVAQLCLEPHYRTVEGFCDLIAREWHGFGHQFAKRAGHDDGGDDDSARVAEVKMLSKENEAAETHQEKLKGYAGVLANDGDEQRSPIFLQFMDCVYQVMVQFPTKFEFTTDLLLVLARHLRSGLFGTFMCNSQRARVARRLPQRTLSLFGMLVAGVNEGTSKLLNPLYEGRQFMPAALGERGASRRGKKPETPKNSLVNVHKRATVSKLHRSDVGEKLAKVAVALSLDAQKLRPQDRVIDVLNVDPTPDTLAVWPALFDLGSQMEVCGVDPPQDNYKIARSTRLKGVSLRDYHVRPLSWDYSMGHVVSRLARRMIGGRTQAPIDLRASFRESSRGSPTLARRSSADRMHRAGSSGGLHRRSSADKFRGGGGIPLPLSYPSGPIVAPLRASGNNGEQEAGKARSQLASSAKSGKGKKGKGKRGKKKVEMITL